MRLNSSNNKFIFNFPIDFIEPRLYEQLQNVMDKNFIPYETILEYINSTIKEIVFPSLSFENVTQTFKRGKQIAYKNSKNINDNFTNEIDISFRSVDSNMNYFILLQILTDFYLDNDKVNIPNFSIDILDKVGDKIYTILFKEVLLKSIGENRMGYQMYDLSEKLFSVTFAYNFIDVLYELDDDDLKTSKSIFDMPIDFKPGELDSSEKGGEY